MSDHLYVGSMVVRSNRLIESVMDLAPQCVLKLIESFDGSVIICYLWDLMTICQSLNMSKVYTKREFG